MSRRFLGDLCLQFVEFGEMDSHFPQASGFKVMELGPDRSTSLSDRPMTREKWTDNGAES